MGDVLKRKKRKLAIMSGILRGLNALTLFTPQILGNLLASSSKKKKRILKLDWKKKGYELVPLSDPLFIRIQKQAAARGVEVENLYVASDPKGINAMVANVERDKAVVFALSFDPRKHPDGDRILDALIAHELSHITNNNGVRESKDHLIPIVCGVAGLVTFLLGVFLPPIMPILTAEIAMLASGGGILLVGAFCAPLLSASMARQIEHIADLEGTAAIDDPEAMVKVVELCAKAQEEVGMKPERMIGKLERMAGFLDNYPPLEDRIACLKEEFNLDGHAEKPQPGPGSINIGNSPSDLHI